MRLAPVSDDVRVRLGVGAGFALTVGIGKELWDLAGHGDPSWKDLAWDALGTGVGVLIAWIVDRLFFPHPDPEPATHRAPAKLLDSPFQFDPTPPATRTP